MTAGSERPDPPRLTVVIPAFEDEAVIAGTIEVVGAALDEEGWTHEIIVVDDGSEDGTGAAARAAGVRVLSHDHNRGKGAAVRTGMAASVGAIVAFTDADLAYGPENLLRLAAKVGEGWDVVVGSRRHTDTVTLVRAGRLREAGGRLINLLTRLVLLGRYVDTQCGLKAFDGETARDLFARTRIDGFAFDVEVFHLVESDGRSMLEHPVTVQNSDTSTVRVGRDGLRLVRDLFRIRRLARDGAYRATGEVRPSVR
jgi:dolichyl-phosphate beta-glucosyltransferase